MADNNGTTIDPRYLSYDKDDVQSLLDKVNNADAEPTAESENMISSGAVAAALENVASVGEKVADVPDEEPEPEDEPDPEKV